MEQSLQAYLKSLPSEDILNITADNDDFFLTALVKELEKKHQYPVVFLKGVKQPYCTVANLFASRERIARAINTPPGCFTDKINKALENPIPPVPAREIPVFEEVLTGEKVDLEILPLARHFQQDAERYISSGIIVARDPDTGRYNLSFHRLQFKKNNRLGVSLHSRGHLWDYFSRAEAQGSCLEVAIIIGAHPAFYLAAATRIPDHIDEYDIAGAFWGEPALLAPCHSVDLEIPAAAEIILEGRILAGVREPEGPFGEYTGYATSRSTNNLIEITAISKRKHALFLELVPGHSAEHLLLSQVTKEAIILKKLQEQVPGIVALNLPKNGCHFHAYLSLRQIAQGQAKHALMLLFGLDPYLKLAIAVDEDIDVFNEEEVMWAVATRMQADKDVFIVPEVFCNKLDPSSRDGVAAKMGIDATRPLNWDVNKLTLPEDVIVHVRELLGKEGRL